ncbi:hypothetical protein BJ508DRAFT_335208 [Ascobolus immersus RN42]|uniref:Uncharacterized protein n=1 Tax=Ascobolus immersus RN42 TaxID=1160509 RepID=A0A3N4HD86_ASCIM|nr:hypothetical protein BJ508DRAFT_335208 [Ascobolus immersus RN42]
MPVKRSTTRPVASKPPAYTPPVDDIAAQLEAHIASINDADPNAAFERQELTRSLREYLRVKNSFRDADERIGINALEYSEMTENEKRLTVLRDYHLHNPNVSEDELVNWRAVMAAYSSGLLDLKDKKAPNEVALFWNGRLIQSWHVQGNNELEKWAEYKKMWGGKAWVEKASLMGSPSTI